MSAVGEAYDRAVRAIAVQQEITDQVTTYGMYEFYVEHGRIAMRVPPPDPAPEDWVAPNVSPAVALAVAELLVARSAQVQTLLNTWLQENVAALKAAAVVAANTVITEMG